MILKPLSNNTINKLIALTFAISFFVSNNWAHAKTEKITLFTSDLPPYVQKQGTAGVVVELVETLMKKANITYEIKNRPHARAIQEVLKKPNTCVFPTQRSQEREFFYQWVSPLLITQNVFVTKAKDTVKLVVLKDAFDYTIGALRGSDEAEYLKGFGAKVEQVNSNLASFKKLKQEKIRIWAVDSLVAEYITQKNKFEMKKELGFRTTLRGLACHIDFDLKKVEELNSYLIKMYHDGTMRKLFAKYGFKGEMLF